MTKKNQGYTENIKHVGATRPRPWPGIQGRSEDKETELPTGTRRAEQAEVTDAQRKLEHEVEESEKVRE